MPRRQAWELALYGPDGFYTRHAPGEHFRTSSTASPRFAGAIADLAGACALATVIDLAAGGGELAAGLESSRPDLTLVAIDRRPRPQRLSDRIEWRTDLPDRIDGLVIANEWLDNVPCSVAEVDDDGRLREVLVDPANGRETLGDDVVGPELEWARRWWPVSEPGHRVEIGRARDVAWRDVVRRLDRGLAVAIDDGHVEPARPEYGSLRSIAVAGPSTSHTTAVAMSRPMWRSTRWPPPVGVGCCGSARHCGRWACTAPGPIWG